MPPVLWRIEDQVIAFLGGFVFVFAALLTTANLVLTLLNASFRACQFQQLLPFDRSVGSGPATITRVRLQLSQLIALGLEILLVGDIVETLVRSTEEYSFESLFKLAIVATIRTTLSYFLGLETREILERAKEQGRLDGHKSDE